MNNPTDLDSSIRPYHRFTCDTVKAYAPGQTEDNPCTCGLSAIIARECDKARIDELEEVMTMCRANYRATKNDDMRVLADYCGRRIIQLKETPPLRAEAAQKGEDDGNL